ncbi:hypothetical protein LBSP_20960 [Lentilactobacillus buchneri subsp. silagei]|uniref:phage holin, LLH family n=1 Tax=Lentilactobacillus buchneri TaxID=1581 RepID=UPI0012E6B5A2|nr:phage holin, LLH family [Lentilactobacillus buchneri]GED95536.1 hypothetical protein LBSP_20960 [Lentilactobacillus buchneri subsp. silagei]
MNLKYIFDFLNSGGFLAALFIFAFGVKKFLDVAQVVADHTKTKKDNEVLDKLKAYAKTAVTFAQSLPVPGNEQMDAAKRALVQWAKGVNYDLSDSEAQKFAEEQYQLIYGQNKLKKVTTPITTTVNIPGYSDAKKVAKSVTAATSKMAEEQAQALADINDKAAETDPTDYPIKLETGDLLEINGQQFKLNTDDDNKITLTKEGK